VRWVRVPWYCGHIYKLLVPCMIRAVTDKYGVLIGTKRPKFSDEKLATVPLYPTQIAHGVPWQFNLGLRDGKPATDCLNCGTVLQRGNWCTGACPCCYGNKVYHRHLKSPSLDPFLSQCTSRQWYLFGRHVVSFLKGLPRSFIHSISYLRQTDLRRFFRNDGRRRTTRHASWGVFPTFLGM